MKLKTKKLFEKTLTSNNITVTSYLLNRVNRLTLSLHEHCKDINMLKTKVHVGETHQWKVESFPVKICSLKSLPGEKRLDFLSPRQYCITYFTPEKYRTIDSPQWVFGLHPMSFDVTPKNITDTPWSVATCHWNHNNSSSRILS